MSVNPEYIEQLVLDEIAGAITPEDSATLNSLLAQEPEALVIRNDLYAQYSDHPALNHLAESLPVEKVWDRIRKRKTSYVLLRTLTGIAASTLIIVGSYILFSPGSRQSNIVQVVPPNVVALQLPNGQTVSLGNTQQQVQVGALTLHNHEKKLSYTSTEINNTQQASLIVPPGKDYSITLSDGTEIQLNTATKLQFPFSFNGNTREVTINGEAYLKVAANPNKPFFVNLPHCRIQVLGTEFNVNTYDSGQVNVALVKGAIKMQTQQDSLLLRPGFAGNFQKGNNEILETTFDAETVLSWRQGIYIFHNASLQDMSKVITRWFGINVVIDNTTSSKHRFTGAIDRNKSIQPFLDGLKFTGQFEYHFDKDSVLHMQ